MTLTITSINVNGIRAATRVRSATNQGFLAWLDATSADIVCMQEVRATAEQTEKALAPALVENGGHWHLCMQEAAAKGRAGVGILSRYAPCAVRTGIGVDEFAQAGRYIEADFAIGSALGGTADSVLTVASLYLPSGEVDTPRQEEKYRFMEGFGAFLHQRAAQVEAGSCPQTVVCGDWNIAHREEDLKNFKANTTNSGFLPAEREWMTSIFGPQGLGRDELGQPTGWTDVQRYLLPEARGPYSWWSYRGKAFDNDAGWRIDYQAITSGLVGHVQAARVERADAYDLRWSDHAPVTVTYR